MKRPLLTALLYAALTLGANPLLAAGLDPATRTAIIDMRAGDMRKMNILPAPKPASDIPYENLAGDQFTLGDTNGRYRLVNFWATWCPPCREEMPTLDALQADLGGDTFEVLTIATGKNRVEDITTFFESAGVENLPVLLDPNGKLGRAMGALGLPTTILLDPEGNEIAHLTGGADWHSENAVAVLKALMGQE